MIANLTGLISEQTTDAVVVQVGGIGYEVFVPSHDLSKLKVGQEAKLHIYEQIREDVHNLYGFVQLETKTMFTKLVGISGIGPKVAMAVLSATTIENLRQAIATGDPDLLKGVSGVGKKTAERIILELKGKVTAAANAATKEGGDSAYEALIALGYPAAQAAQAAAAVPADIKDEKERVKAALRQVAK